MSEVVLKILIFIMFIFYGMFMTDTIRHHEGSKTFFFNVNG